MLTTHACAHTVLLLAAATANSIDVDSIDPSRDGRVDHLQAARRVGPTNGSRRVNWFVYPVAIGHEQWNTSARTLDGLNNTAWALRHRGALTGYSPCCGCWDILPNGTFVASGMCVGLHVPCQQYPLPGMQKRHRGVPCDPRMQAQREAEAEAEAAMGLEIYPTGTMHHDTMDYLLKPGADQVHDRWQQPGSMDSAVELVRRHGWAGLQYDNEISKPGNPLWDERLPAQYNAFVGNLSAALTAAGFRLIVDVTSTWRGNIAGPDYLAATAKAAPDARFMDMATYFNTKPNGMTMPETLGKLVGMLGNDSSRAIAAVGAQMLPGYENASCASATSCIDYKWTKPAFAAFVRDVEAAGIPEIDVYRFDRDPPHGTVSALAPWMIDELAGFLGRGRQALSE